MQEHAAIASSAGPTRGAESVQKRSVTAEFMSCKRSKIMQGKPCHDGNLAAESQPTYRFR